VSIEIAHLEVREERVSEFLDAFTRTAVPLLREGGAADFTVYRDQERPTAFVLVCTWPSRTARVEEFGRSPLYTRFLTAVGEYLTGPPSIGDYDAVFTDR
jgi:quinol monooxygenase YgiN